MPRVLTHTSPGIGDYGWPTTNWHPTRGVSGWWCRPGGIEDPWLRLVVFCNAPPLGPYGVTGLPSHTWLIYDNRKLVAEGMHGPRLHGAMEAALAAARIHRRERRRRAWLTW